MSERRRYADSVTSISSIFWRYDEKTQAALSRLNQLSLPKLTLYTETLNQDDYQQLFFGGICDGLQSRKLS